MQGQEERQPRGGNLPKKHIPSPPGTGSRLMADGATQEGFNEDTSPCAQVKPSTKEPVDPRIPVSCQIQNTPRLSFIWHLTEHPVAKSTQLFSMADGFKSFCALLQGT